MTKDDSVVVPVDPTFPELVTGVGEINANKIKFTFPATNVRLYEPLSYSSLSNADVNSGKFYRYNRIDKSINLFYRGNNTCYRFDKELGTWSTFRYLDSSYTSGGSEVGTDGNIYSFGSYNLGTGPYNSIIFKYDLATQTISIVVTVETETLYNLDATLMYNLRYQSFVSVYYFIGSYNTKKCKKINYLTKSVSDVPVWNISSTSGTSGVGNATIANYSNMSCMIYGTVSGSTHSQGIQYRNESNGALTTLNNYPDYIASQPGTGFDAGYGKIVYNRFSNIGDGITIFNPIAKFTRTVPQNLIKNFGGLSGGNSAPVCYDTDDHYLYWAYYSGSGRTFGRIKTDLVSFPGGDDAEFNYVLDLNFILSVGLKVFVTISTGGCYMKTENGSYQQLITNQRVELKSAILLKAPSYVLQGLIEITQ